MTCSNDILGNRLTKGAASYGWDVLNRMTSYTSPSPDSITTSYVYRADGMRVSKSDSTGSAVYRYDGQMCMQDVETPTSGTQTVTNYALGARGVDAVSKQDGADPAVVGYPIYDAHGNRVATLVKSGTSFSLTDVRSYDAWGNVRVGAQTGRPRARYCAKVGHVQDDESGLVYMRARYYEPTSGRFVSEDCQHEGWNWFSYCRNSPTTGSDPSGANMWDDARQAFTAVSIGLLLVAGAMAAVGGLFKAFDFAGKGWGATELSGAWILVGLAGAAAAAAAGLSDRLNQDPVGYIRVCVTTPFVITCLNGIAQMVGEGYKKGALALVAVTSCAAYTSLVLALLIDLHSDED